MLQYIEGRGRLVDAHTVEVAGRTVTAKHILIATGARAFVPGFEGSELCIISDDALELPEVGCGWVDGGCLVGVRVRVWGGGAGESHQAKLMVWTCT